MRILLLFIGLSCFGLNAQKVDLDSLVDQWSQKKFSTDSVLFELFYANARDVGFTSPDESIVLADILYEAALFARKDLYLALSLQVKGNGLKNIGEKEKAIICFESALQLFVRLGLPVEESIALESIGNSYMDLGNYNKSEQFLSKALKKCQIIADSVGIASVYNNLGIMNLYSGDTTAGLGFLTKSIEIKEKLNNPRSVLISKLNVGGILKESGEFSKSLEIFSECAESARINNLLFIEAVSFENMGGVYNSLRRFEQSIKYHQKAIEIFQKFSYAEGILQSYGNLGIAYKNMGDWKSSLLYGHMSLKLARENNSALGERNALEALYRTFMACDSLEKAYSAVVDLIDLRIRDTEVNLPVLSEIEKEKYMKSIDHEFSYLFEFLLFSGQIWQEEMATRCFDLSCRIKGALLKSSTLMKKRILSSGDTTLISDLNAWISLNTEIIKGSSNNTSVSNLQMKADSLEKKMARESTEFWEYENLMSTSFDEVIGNLKEGEALVEIVQFSHQNNYKEPVALETVYCSLIGKPDLSAPHVVYLFTQKELEQILGKYPGNNLEYIEKIYGTNEDPKHELYNLIWKPIDEALGDVHRVFVSPTGLLHRVSFSALAKETGIYICDMYNLDMISSSGNITLKQSSPVEKETSNFSYSIFGGVDFNSDSTQKELWRYLDGSLTEVEKIKAVLKKKHVNYFTAKNASEENIKIIAPKSNILHIATHGFFYPDPEAVEEEIVDAEESDEDLAFRGGKSGFGVESFVKNQNPLMRSGLALAGANDVWSRMQTDGEDGVLTAAEVATIDMRNTELVVLSACETGLGDIKGSEGVYGLQRSFKMAGVNYIIMSLWQVPDKETAEFMTTFYKHLTKTNDIKESFKLTQKTMRQKYDPYYWAAFVLVE